MPSRRVFKERILREARQQSVTSVVNLGTAISALPTSTTFTATDDIPLLRGGVAYKGAASALRTYVLGISGGIANIAEPVALGSSLSVTTSATAATLVGTTRVTAPLFGTTTATDVVIDRNSVTQLTLGSLLATFAGAVAMSGTLTGVTTGTATTWNATNLGGTLTTATQNSVTTMTGLTTIGTLVAGAVPASLVTAGTFGAGAYTFPSTLVVTSTLTQNGTTASLVQSATSATLRAGSGTGSSNTFFELNGATALSHGIRFQIAGSNRWIWQTDGVAESGSNAGTGFQLLARTDAGAGIDVPLFITRAAGGTIAFSSARPITGGTYNGQTITSAASFTGTLGVSGVTTLSNLSGVGSRMVVADASGVLSTAAIPTGDVVGPASAVDSNLAAFDTATGKLLKDSLIPMANVIVSSGSYANPAWLTSLAWSKLTSTPTTIAGYGITDFNSLGDARWVSLSGSYANPAWITSIAWSKISGTPTTIGGYGITDFTSLGDAQWVQLDATSLPASIVTSSLTTIGTLIAGAVPASLVTAGTFASGTFTFQNTLTQNGAVANFVQSATTGSVLIGSGTGSGQTEVRIRGAAGQLRDITFDSGSIGRWTIRSNANTESGSNAGSNFEIISRDDAGTFLRTDLTITRSNGAMATAGTFTVASDFTNNGQSALFAQGASGNASTAVGSGSQTGGAFLRLRAPALQYAQLILSRGTLARWAWYMDNTAESGANAGSQIRLAAHDDAGVYIDNVMSVDRSAGGTMAFTRPISHTATIANFAQSATTASVTVGLNTGAGNTDLTLRSAAGYDRSIYWRTGTSARWRMYVTATAESGANAGSGFIAQAFDDAGSLIDNWLTISRVAGGTIAFNSARPITGGTYNGQTFGAASILTGALAIAGALTGVTDLTMSGNLVVNGNTTLGNATSDTITTTARLASNLFPSVDDLYSLGTSGLSFSEVWANQVNIGPLTYIREAPTAGNYIDTPSSGFSVNDVPVVQSQGAAVADPTGGTVQDTECRAQLSLLLARLRASTGHGLIA